MGRPRQFDRDEAVRQAMEHFWSAGYPNVSTNTLCDALNIGRQSLYDTFGGKDGAFLEALALYSRELGEVTRARLESGRDARAGIEAHLLSVANGTEEQRRRGCLAVNSTIELGAEDSELGELIRKRRAHAVAMFEKVIKRGQADGSIEATLVPRDAARYVLSSLEGMQVAARAGTPPKELVALARMVTDSLAP